MERSSEGEQGVGRTIPALQRSGRIELVDEAVVEWDGAWRCVYRNRRAADILGRTPQEPVDVVEPWIEEAVGQPLEQDLPVLTLDPADQGPGGRTAPWHDESLGFVEQHDPEPAEAMSFAIAQDVTEELREDDLAQARREILEATLLGDGLTTIPGRIALVLEQRFPDLAVTRDDGACAVAAATGEVVITWDVASDPLWEDHRDAALAHDRAFAFVRERGTILRDASGRAVWIIGGLPDEPERRELERKYLQAQRMESIGAPAGGIARDLNNVFAPIVLAADLLEHEELTETGRDAHGSILTSARRGAEMVGQVLTFATGLDGERGPVDLTALLAELERLVRDRIGPGIEVDIAVADDVAVAPGRRRTDPGGRRRGCGLHDGATDAGEPRLPRHHRSRQRAGARWVRSGAG